MICPKCKAYVESGFLNCYTCGASLPEQDKPKQEKTYFGFKDYDDAGSNIGRELTIGFLIFVAILILTNGGGEWIADFLRAPIGIKP